MTLVAGCSFAAGQAPADTSQPSPDALVPTWSVDGTSAKGVPSTASEWQQLTDAYALGLGVPDHLWTLQETSGDLADAIGGAPLTPINLPTYRNAVMGWSRLAVGTIDRDGDYGFATGSVGNLDGADHLVLVYAAVSAAPATERSLVGLGLANDHRFAGVNASGRLELAGSTATAVASGASLDAAVHPLVLAVDGTAQVVTLYTESEKLAGSIASMSGLGDLFVLGSAGKGTVNARYLYAATWRGTRARSDDADVKRLLTALGWTVAGY